MLWIESKLIYGNYTNAIRGNCRLPTHATRQRQPKQSGCVKRHFVCSRTGLQMARPAQAFWQLAHDLHSNESLEQEWRARPFVPEVAAIADCAHQDRGGIAGQHHGESSSRRHRRVKKNRAQAIGKSRGGWTTNIHMVAADARTAITFSLSPGQTQDSAQERQRLTK